jgi:hypothetical protein
MNPLKRFFSSNFFKGFLFSVALFTSPKALGSETKLLQANLKASFQKDKDKISKPLCLVTGRRVLLKNKKKLQSDMHDYR